MKKLFTLIAALLFAATVWAQSGCPQRMSYQAVVRNAANELVTSKTGIKVKIEITDGTKSYKEYHTVNSNQNGLISLMVGEGSSIEGTMEGMNWPSATFTTTVTVPGESAVTATTTVEAVPYALYACDINPEGVNITKIVTDINNHIVDTLNNYYTKNETDNKYLTIDGLCDSIKKCEVITSLQTDTVQMLKNLISNVSGDLTNYYTKSETDNKFLTIDGLCDSIKNCEVIKTIEGDITTIEGSITTISGKVSTIEGDITNIKKDYLTIDGLCDSIKNNCSGVALRGEDNTFSDKNTFTDTVYVNNGAVKADGSIAATDSLRAVNAKDLVNYTSNAIHDSITNNVSSMLKDSLENYMTIDGLCDSIKNCEVIKTIEGDITTIEGSITTIEGDVATISGKVSTIEGDITNIKKDYLTIDGLCDSIKNNCSVAFTDERNVFTKRNRFQKVVILEKGAVQPDGTILTTDSLNSVNGKDLVNYTGKVIHDSIVNNISTQIHDTVTAHFAEYEIKNCEDVNKCVVEGLRTQNTTINNVVDSLVMKNVLDSISVNTSKINNAIDTIVDNRAAKQWMDVFTVSTAEQVEFTISKTPKSNTLVKMYINGVMVGGYTAGMTNTVITVSGKTVTYVPANNPDACGTAYKLKAGDRVAFEYWY